MDACLADQTHLHSFDRFGLPLLCFTEHTATPTPHHVGHDRQAGIVTLLIVSSIYQKKSLVLLRMKS